MDFASLMKSQIAASSPSTSTSKSDTSKKYLKRSEVEAQRQADYLKEQAELEKARLERVEKKRKREEEEAEQNRAREEKRKRLAEEGRRVVEEEAAREERERRVRLGLPAEVETKEEVDRDGKDEEVDREDDIPDDELLEKLQELGEPRRLFGETHSARLKRYRALVASTTTTLSTGPIPTTIPLLPEAEMLLPSSLPSPLTKEAQTHIHNQLASYYTLLLKEWSHALASRPAEVKASFSGKQAAQSYTTTISNLTPLFRALESSNLPRELLGPIVEITHLAQKRRYVDANDAYLRFSIGKAAWPIGVTMVGIHERSAREKLHEAEKGREGGKAQILADERTRKMLQGIKRGLSFAQTRWPPEDAGQIMG